ncbi:hypothetical protein [Natrarchaeobius oligotrophus]|uniref:hypothetical protein n=1 Tax=Natrarchaeobius oligotrophus TaxID=3455743 RepID=UPI000F525104|nr:hypothetical protein [Natrarchaeobius chitinivorans]
MNFDSPPKDASDENLLELCEVLRESDHTREELYDAVDQGKTLVRDNIRLGVGLGFLEESEEGISATPRGIEASYNQDDPNDLADQFQAGIQEYQLYNIVLKELVVNGVTDEDSITKSDILQVFRTEIGLEGSENTLGSAATTFLQILEAAGLGDYIVGRGGNETRLELDEEFEDLANPIIEDKPEQPDTPDSQTEQENTEIRTRSKTTDTPVPEVQASNPFQISLELSGDEDPAKVEELIVAVRRGLNRDLEISDLDLDSESEDIEENLGSDQEDSEEELEFSEKENDAEGENESESDSSDSSLDTFMGSESEADEE